MKYRDLEQGPITGRLEDFERPGGVVHKVRVMPLLAGRDREIETGAAEYVNAENKAHPDAPPAQIKPGDPTYERGIYAHTVWRAVLDPDDGAPYFSGGVAEMLDPDKGLDRDRLAMLFELQQQAQADFAPRAGQLTSATYFEWLERTAEAEDGAELPFERSPRVMQRAYHRGTARSYKRLIGEHLTAVRELDRLRLEIDSLRAKSTSGPSLLGSATNSQSSVTGAAGVAVGSER